MPRARSLFPIALSLESAAKAMSIPTRLVHDAVYVTGELPAFKASSNHITRIRVVDLNDWILTWPKAVVKRKIKRSVPK